MKKLLALVLAIPFVYQTAQACNMCSAQPMGTGIVGAYPQNPANTPGSLTAAATGQTQPAYRGVGSEQVTPGAIGADTEEEEMGSDDDMYSLRGRTELYR